MGKNRYVISFLVKNINWVSISSIDKETFYSFIKHLYLLKRKIVVLPYLCGGFLPPMRPVLDKDKTSYINYPEERRLFYVALTRTKNKVYILSPYVPIDKRSEFVREIENNENVSRNLMVL